MQVLTIVSITQGIDWEVGRMIVRQKYLDKLIAFQDTDLVKVVTAFAVAGNRLCLT